MANDIAITLPQFNSHLSGVYATLNIPSLSVQGKRNYHAKGKITLPLFTDNFKAKQGTVEKVDITLPALTVRTRLGLTSSHTLPQLSLTTVAHSGYVSRFAKRLPRMTVRGTGTVHTRATFNVSLPRFTFDTNAPVGVISKASTRNLPLLELNAIGLMGENGDIDLTLPIFTMSTESYNSLNGTVVQSLRMLTLYAYADVYINRII